MPTYAILPHPGVSSVFFDASECLSLAELTLCLRRLSTSCAVPRAETVAGARWYLFDAAARLPDADIRRLSALSCLYALFEAEGELFRPVAPLRDAPFGESLSAILKYTGKTNALFTRLMLHIATLSLETVPAGRPRLLDPVAGKGTTLFEALMRGYDAAGVEIVKRAALEAANYFQKYLETEKWKHKLKNETMFGAQAWRFAFARDKEGLRDAPGEWLMVAGDSKMADRLFGKNAFDIVAGDLPYGVAHGNIAGGDLARSPKALLSACLPAWRTTLKPGGVLALSWNILVFPASEMRALLAQSGFAPLTDAPYDQLAHRVDASIVRDIAVAVRR